MLSWVEGLEPLEIELEVIRLLELILLLDVIRVLDLRPIYVGWQSCPSLKIFVVKTMRAPKARAEILVSPTF